jgi:uncharacterized protein
VIDVSQITGPGSAFVAGLVVSFHCVGMCGPMAVLLSPAGSGTHAFPAIASVYQVCRIVSYTVIGALAGALGLLALQWLQAYQLSLFRYLPWALVLFFVGMALRVDRWIPKPQWFSRLLWQANAKLRASNCLVAAAVLGTLTPLLPCGPLYAMFGLALMTQSPVRGAEFSLAFGLGTLPLLYLAQSRFVWWQQRMKPETLQWMQRGIAAIAAVVVGARLYLAETGEGGLFCG